MPLPFPDIQVEQERATTEVLAIQNEHRQASACAEGKAEAERCLTFLAAVRAVWRPGWFYLQGYPGNMW